MSIPPVKSHLRLRGGGGVVGQYIDRCIIQTFFSQLILVLPMDNLSLFNSQGLLPGNHKNKIKSLTTQPEKAEYFLDSFLDNVIRPGLEIGYDKQFKDLLKLMENSDDSKVKHLADKITTALTDVSITS